jgi:hypothetical protein
MRLTKLEFDTIRKVLDDARMDPTLSQEFLGITSKQKAALERAYQKLFVDNHSPESIRRQKTA